MKISCVASILLTVFNSQVSFAAPQTLYFTGTVTSTDANQAAVTEVQEGDKVTGWYSFDTDAADEMASAPSSGLYEAESFALTVNGYHYTATDNSISVTNDAVVIPGQPAMDTYEVVTPLRDVSGPSLSGLPIAQIDLVVLDTDATNFLDDSLPASLNIAEFEVTSEDPYGTTGGRVTFQSLATGGIAEIRFEITGISMTSPGTILYFPHAAAQQPWQTEIGIINTSSNRGLTGSLNGYADAGQLVASLDISLAPRARREIDLSQSFTSPVSIGYLTLEANSTEVYGYTKFFVDGQYRVAIPATQQTNSADMYVSHIASSENWWTGISILNTTSTSQDLTFLFDDGTSLVRTIAGSEHQAFTIASLFGGDPQPAINSAVIQNGSGIVGLELFGSTTGSGNSYLSGILLKDDTASTLYYPHLAVNSWWTGVVAYNPASTTTSLTITPYSAAGEILSGQQQSVGGTSKYIGTVSSLNLPDQAAWFTISASNPVTGFELFGTADGKQLAGYTAVGLQRNAGIFAKLEKRGWTGIALVNSQGRTAEVTMTAYSDNGAMVASQTVNLGPYEKLVDLPANIFGADLDAATYLSFSSDGEVVGFQLNGSGGGRLLDALPGL